MSVPTAGTRPYVRPKQLSLLDQVKNLVNGHTEGPQLSTGSIELASAIDLSGYVAREDYEALQKDNADLRAQLATQGTQLAAIKGMLDLSQKEAEDNKKEAKYANDCASVDALVRQFKITPASADQLKSLAKNNPDAFSASLSVFQSAAPIPGLAGDPKTNKSGETPTDASAFGGGGDANVVASRMKKAAQASDVARAPWARNAGQRQKNASERSPPRSPKRLLDQRKTSRPVATLNSAIMARAAMSRGT